MTLKLAWRNIWRNKTRSIVIITAITLGIIASLFLDAFAQGMVRSFIEDSIEKVTSHIQVHSKGYLEDEDVKNYILQSDRVLQTAKEMDVVDKVAARTIVNAMIASSRTSQNVMIKGINTEDEAAISTMFDALDDGEYLQENSKNKILISSRLAEKLTVKTGSKVVLTFMDMEKDITAGLFRIVGLYDSGNNNYDEQNVFVLHKDLMQTMVSDGEEIKAPIHEIAILLHEKDQMNVIVDSLRNQYPDLDIQAYNELSPELGLYESQMDFITWFYFIIIMFALIFGIVNTMLMAVLDRYKEFGVLMAVGLGKTKLFLLVMTETIMLCLVAAPLGMLLGYLIITYFSGQGINLDMWSEFLEEYGMSPIVYTQVNALSFIRLTLILLATAIVAALYPAWKAIRLNPLEAIRKI